MKTHHLLAYLDPGSSGVIIQMLGGGFAAALVAAKLYGRRVLRALHLSRREDPPTKPDPAADYHAL